MAKKKNSHSCKKVHVKKGDRVIVLSGDYKGDVQEVLEVIPEKYRAIVNDINIVKKHQKANNDNPGGIIEVPASIHLSNLALVDPKSGNAVRIGRRIENDKRVRFSKESGEII